MAQIFTPTAVKILSMVARVENEYEPANTKATADAYLADVNKPLITLLEECGFNESHETYDWIKNHAAPEVVNNRAAFKVWYTKNREIFSDALAGISGLNTPRTQAGVCFKDWTTGVGGKRAYGSSFQDNAARNKPIPPNSYKTNFKGNRFWKNLEVNFIEDAVLVGLTSADMKPISTTNRMILVAAPNYSVTGSTFKSKGKTIVNIPVTAGGSGYTKPPVIQLSNQNAGFAGVGILDANGSVIGVRILFGGTGLATTVTATVVPAAGDTTGNGATLGAPEFDDDDPNQEIKTFQPFPNDGSEGWPILQHCAVTDINVIDIDMSKPWRLFELTAEGDRIDGGEIPVRVLPDGKGINVRIDSKATVQPTVFYELVQGATAADRFVRQRMM